MSYDLLSGLRIVEISAFVAAPLAGLTLAQLGAELIRIDPPGGSMDRDRWPLAPDGSSLYWAGLNRAKTSVGLDLRTDVDRAVLHRILEGGDEGGGIVLTNLAGPDWLSFEALSAVRKDLILVTLTGHHDGAPAVDYTVNAGVGVPFATGPEGTDGPVNHMLPAWDAVAGLTLSTALLAAVHARTRTGEGQHLTVALSDVAYALLGNLGVMAETELSGVSRPRIGNSLYGAFGLDLPTRDGRHVMVVAITGRQWQALVRATDSEVQLMRIEDASGEDLSTEAGLYRARRAVGEVLRLWSAERDFDTVCRELADARVLWGPYRTFAQMMDEDPRASTANPLIHDVPGPDGRPLRVPGSTIRMANREEGPLAPASRQGADTDDLLQRLGIDRTDTTTRTHDP